MRLSAILTVGMNLFIEELLIVTCSEEVEIFGCDRKKKGR